MNSTKVNDLSSTLSNEQIDTATYNSIPLIEQISELIDRKLSNLRITIREDMNEQLSSIRNELAYNKSAITSIQERVSTIEAKMVDNSEPDPFTLLRYTSNISDELKNIEARNNNLMVYGVQDIDTADLSVLLQHDFLALNEIFKHIDNLNVTSQSIRRIGKFSVNKTRPICVTLSTRQDVFKVINNQKKLPEGIKLSTDKTRLQQATFRHLKDISDKHNTNYPLDPLHIKIIGNVPHLRDNNNVIRDPKNTSAKLKPFVK